MKRKLLYSIIFLTSLFGLVVICRWSSEPLKDRYPHSAVVLDREGRTLRIVLSGDEKLRLFTPLERIPPRVSDAFLHKEDQMFRYHFGINPWGVVRAGIRTYLLGERREGASTVTMQLARLLKPIHTRRVSGKIQQMAWALWFELIYSKSEILEAYLNKLPFGGNIEGIGSAAWIFFGKSVAELNDDDLSRLVDIPQRPARAKTWLRQRLPFEAPHFTGVALANGHHTGEIKTTLDLKVQHRLERILTDHLSSTAKLGVSNGAALLIQAERREVLAWIGSADFFDSGIAGQVDGVRASRSPGSALKPFLYALALEQGLIHPQSLLKDIPRAYGAFVPENFDREFSGPLSATEALTGSRNLPAVQLGLEVKNPNLYGLLSDGGLHFPFPEAHYGPGLALGGVEVSLLQLAAWYTALHHLGKLAPLSVIANGSKPMERAWLTPEASFLVLDMLASPSHERIMGRSPWTRDHFPVAWKTGTSQGYRDAWTVGVFGPYVLVVWLGNFDGSSNPHLVGRDLAAPVFFDMADAIYQMDLAQGSNHRERTQAQSRFQHPVWKNAFGLNLKRVKVCALSGQFAKSICHQHRDTWFIPGQSPIQECQIHRKVIVSRLTGQRLCQPDAKELADSRVVEFWPSDLMRLFRLAGLPRKSPPPWAAGCEESAHAQGLGPSIVSPREHVEYRLNPLDGEIKPIALIATVDADARHLKWFINRKFVGESGPESALFWPPISGRHLIRVIDEHGRADERDLIVGIAD